MAGERPPLGARSPPALRTRRLLSLTFLPLPAGHGQELTLTDSTGPTLNMA